MDFLAGLGALTLVMFAALGFHKCDGYFEKRRLAVEAVLSACEPICEPFFVRSYKNNTCICDRTREKRKIK